MREFGVLIFTFFRHIIMHLYNLTLQGVTAINCSVHGSFTGVSKQQVIISFGLSFIKVELAGSMRGSRFCSSAVVLRPEDRKDIGTLQSRCFWRHSLALCVPFDWRKQRLFI